MIKIWEKQYLGTKFALILTTFLLLTGVTTGALLSQRSAMTHRQQSVETLSVAAKMLAVHIDEYMNRLLQDLEQLQFAAATVPKAKQADLLKDFMVRRPEVTALRYASNGQSIAAGDWLGESLVITGSKEARQIFPADVIEGVPVMGLATSSTADNIVAQVNLVELSMQQGLFDIQLGESGHPYLLDSRGIVISHRYERYVSMPVYDLLTMNDGSRGDVDLFTGATFTLLEYSMNDAQRISGVVPLPHLGLIVGFSQALEEVEQPAILLRRSLWFSALLLTIALIFLALLLGRMVSKPLHTILAQLEKIREGHIFSMTGGNESPEFGLIRCAVNKLINRLHEMPVATVASLVLILEAKDSATKGHSQRVSEIACLIAETMGYSGKDLRVLARAALLHDVGKIAVPDEILLKSCHLNEQEKQIVNSHPSVAKRILSPLLFLEEEIKIIEQHHERMDGSGYPHGLTGEQVHPLAKILAVADAYEAMTSDRPYRRALSYYEAIKRLLCEKDAQFCSEVVDAFITLMERRMYYGRGVSELAFDGKAGAS
ncbi:MAG: HD domain-containing protein [Bacillota bacterium]|nr:HD domain-containing protein [Bacillota bacterium]MDW7683031.1 HD domain-containing protein [Bacillota bacterium]